MLSPDQAVQLASFSSAPPTPDDVVQFIGQITEVNKTRKSNVFAGRIQPLLSSVQQYSSALDVCAGSHPAAGLAWGSVKLVLLVDVPSLLQALILMARPFQTSQSISTSCRNSSLSSAHIALDSPNMSTFSRRRQGCRTHSRSSMPSW